MYKGCTKYQINFHAQICRFVYSASFSLSLSFLCICVYMMKMFSLFAKNNVLFRSPKSYLVIIINFFLELQDSLYRSRSILQRLFGFSIAWSTKIFMVKASRYLCLSRFEFRRSLLYSKLQSLLGQQKFAKLNVGTAGLVTLGIDPTPEDRYFIRILVVAWSTKAFTTG